ncbi:hypothetical protein [Snuella lapsa]|uniref:Uncharacterized protein n=1 Tax=Snuella lapsa TaxID=870481 RepID=A0ABP6WRP7_9FLAO
MKTDLIIRYIENNMDDQEKLKMLQWICSNEGNQRSFNLIKARYVASKLKDID